MSATETSVRGHLAAAVVQVNAAFARLPKETQESIDLNDCAIDNLLDRALLDGNRDDARAAIKEWRDHYLRMFEEADR